jgi:hypothetical protein
VIKHQFKSRIIYGAITLLVLMVGFGSRKFGFMLPQFIATFAGDTLWAMMIYWGCRTLFILKKKYVSVYISLTFTVLIEISELYHAPWIDVIRAITIGGLILGYDFYWPDLVCYSVGIFLSWCIDYFIVKNGII